MNQHSDTKWFKEAKWGIFMHYLASPASSIGESKMTIEHWNRQIDAFDVDGLATQLKEIEAGYFFITLGQNSGFFLSPNSKYDEIVGRNPSESWCSQRDLIADLADALNGSNVRLMVYLPAVPPIFDKETLKAFKFAPPWSDRDPGWGRTKIGDFEIIEDVDSRLSEFQSLWESVICEWSMRWGKNVHGWWVDGVYHPDLMYDFPDEPNFVSFTNAMKAGNPESLVAYAVSCGHPEVVTDFCDYTAGEVNYFLPVSGKHAKFGGKTGRAQYHLLTFLGEYWGMGTPRFSTELACAWSTEVVHHGGVITWDVPSCKNGLIKPEFMHQLEAIRESLRFITV